MSDDNVTNYHHIYPSRYFPEGIEAELDSQPFDFLLTNPYLRTDDFTGIYHSNYQKTDDIVGGMFHNNFNRLD